MSYDIVFKRIYASQAADDGARILVDRLWPRGKSRASLGLDEWYRDASPAPALRRDYHRQNISEDVFRARYREALETQPDVLLPLMRYARKGRLTLLTAARDPEHSHLPVLRQAVIDALQREDADDSECASPPCFLDRC
ncbi:DUF488 domain-containing protein [Vreelandella arcis]|uniref:Uncharacterized conserved protein YeaO, DUF488 family n=1 Tax=Vreelandella arcis TaxID=416873 RepID=A0A1G9YCM0_9GAMM|nr:DUF488 family protein [Halomonas arcis]SDN06858.1 Uncharacterized conserved protein YeaO, DUF488 family [Halomonas arcis]